MMRWFNNAVLWQCPRSSLAIIAKLWINRFVNRCCNRLSFAHCSWYWIKLVTDWWHIAFLWQDLVDPNATSSITNANPIRVATVVRAWTEWANSSAFARLVTLDHVVKLRLVSYVINVEIQSDHRSSPLPTHDRFDSRSDDKSDSDLICP